MRTLHACFAYMLTCLHYTTHYTHAYTTSSLLTCFAYMHTCTSRCLHLLRCFQTALLFFACMPIARILLYCFAYTCHANIARRANIALLAFGMFTVEFPPDT